MGREAEVGEEEQVIGANWPRPVREAAPTTEPKRTPGGRRKRMPYVPALDGLRAVAVAAVLLFHGTGWLPGGFLGVEVFFVLSGYLITSLLLGEWRATGQVDLRAFWIRRARRLLPALGGVVVATLAYALVFLPEEVGRLRTDALAAAGYVMNWHLVLSDQPYFQAMGRPSMLQHLWSLAVEEQFYLLWPPLFVVLIGALTRRRVALVVAGVACASAMLAALLYDPASDNSRLYYATDTRAAGPLIGAALAMVWMPWRRRGVIRQGESAVLDVTGFAALAILGVCCLWLDEANRLLYRGGLAFAAVTTAVAIAVAVHPGAGTFPALLSAKPLRWAGTRSYALYLWHWPVFVVTQPGADVPLDGLQLFALRLAVTAALAEVSYRFVEHPFRTANVREVLHALRHADGTRGWRIRAATFGATMAVLFVVVWAVTTTPPGAPHYLAEASVHEVIPSQNEPGVPGEPTPSETAASATPTEGADTPVATPTLSPAVDATTAPTTAPLPADAPILAIGDSVMVTAAQEMGRVGTVEVDAEVGRQNREVIEILRERRARGQLPGVVVLHTGNNGPLTAGQLDEMLQLLAGVERVVLVTVRVPRPWEAGNNSLIRAAEERYDNVRVADWYGASAGRYELFWDDGIHPRPEGAVEYANLIAAALAAP